MNKVAAAVLAAAMVGSMAVPAFADVADSSDIENQATGSTTVTYTVAQSYKWTVPNEVAFNATTKTLTGNVTVKECIINEGATLKIGIASTGNEVDDSNTTAFKLKRYVDNNQKGNVIRTYKVKKTNSSDGDLSQGAEVLNVTSGANSSGESLKQNLTFTLDEDSTKFETAGTYRGTLAFTASVVEAQE